MSTFRKAVETNIPLVTTHWIEACKEQLCQVPAEDPRFLPYNIQRYHDELPLYVLKTKARRPMTDSKITSKPWKKLAERDKAGKPADEQLNKPVEAKRPMTDSKISSKPWKKLVERDKASKPADEPSNKPVEVRRPMTDSKITSKPRKKLAERDKAGKPADEPSNKPVEAGKLEHHTVAGDFRKAQHFDKILKSPILQSSSEETDNAPSDNVEEKQSSRKSRSIRKRIFNSSSDEEGKQDQEKEKSVHEGSMMDDSSFELRISYDSDVLLSDAKKQAATNRFSTPGRLLIARKCKRLLTSCQKPVQNLAKPDTADRQNTAQKQASQSTKKPTAGEESEKESNKQEPKKRKLLMNSQVIPDSTEHTPEVQDVRCLSVATPEGKRVKVGSKQKTAKGAPAPVISDWESDNSVTRARRESSSLFVKKEKKAAAQRSIPTIVCTRLTSEEVEKVASIVAKLGKFIVEATVTERTTHLITPKPTHTVNLFKGIARGCWVLNVKWVYDSLEADRWLHEEKYEMLEFSPSVRQARLERQAFGREFRLELFSGVGAVYVCPSTTPPQADLVELLHLCGATVVSSAHAAHLVVGSVQNLSPTLGKRPPLLVREKWVLDSIKQLTGLDPSDYMQAETSGHQDFKGFA